jgi:putative heme-binding domain-containing protein
MSKLALVLAVAVSAMTPSLAQPKQPPKGAATPVDALAAPDGFKVELLASADAKIEGSWINLGKDNKGRLVIGGQGGQPTHRVTIKDGRIESTEKLKLPVSEVMGLLFAHDSLYVMGGGPKGYGIYRCRESGTAGEFDAQPFKIFGSGGEHGAHGMALGKDGLIYVMAGNHTKLPEGMAADSQYKNFREDLLLPRQWDGNGHAAGILAPGGYVVRTDADGKKWQLVLGGFRNAYDLAFNTDGELFTFDSDMEWDWGMPWYRPTRVNHCTSGSEHGWRSGTGVWPDYYPDSLPPTVNIGIGSPTGVSNGIGAKFPARYQRALFICDWSYGRLMAVHLTPKGSGYTATFENFVAPKGLVDNKSPKRPLPLTDVVVGDDGAMYFTVGGRNNQAGQYRVTYVGTESTASAVEPNKAGAKERALRHSIEAFHGKTDLKAVETVWPHLNSDDRFIRFAARVAVEAQPVAEWREKAIAEKQPTAALTALLALARGGDFKDFTALLTSLEKFPTDKLTDEQKLEKLRVLEVSFARHGNPSAEATKKIIAELDPLFPAADEVFNHEAVQVLVYLQSPKVLAKALKLMAEAKTQEDRYHYLFHLRTLPVGFWTLAQRTEYLSYWTKDKGKMAHPKELLTWFEQAGRGYGDGASYANFFKNFLKEYVANMAPAEVKELTPVIAAIDKAAAVTVEAKVRPFVQKWTMADLEPELERASRGRSFEKGKVAFADAQCAKCHRFVDYGGSVGPDLTAAANRFDRRALLESIVEPSKVISEQYQNIEVNTADGKTVVGRLVDETADTIAIQPDPLDAKRVEISKANIDSRKPSKLSPMAAHLIDVLPTDEILDLIAYIESGGRRQHPAFGKK